ncbi:MAG: DUF6414 family protein [Moraxella sp.]
MTENSPNIKSLYDFFYLDNTKIEYLYAQLNGSGTLTQLKKTYKKTDAHLMEATVGIPTVTGGKIGSQNTADTSSEQQYDTKAIMPRDIIDRLDELGFIGRDLVADNLGRLILLKGHLSVVDVDMFKQLIQPALNFYINDLNHQIKASSGPVKQALQSELADIKRIKNDMIELIKGVPFAIQGRFLSKTKTNQEDYHNVWMTLNRDELIGDTNDLNFKHGLFVSGEWYLLGVLDALPYDDFSYQYNSNQFNGMIEHIITSLKEAAGRPKESFGITPIAIFRNIEPHINQP